MFKCIAALLLLCIGHTNARSNGYIFRGPSPRSLNSHFSSPIFKIALIHNITLETKRIRNGIQISLKRNEYTFFTSVAGKSFINIHYDVIETHMSDGNLGLTHNIRHTSTDQFIDSHKNSSDSIALVGIFILNNVEVPYEFKINVISQTHITFELESNYTAQFRFSQEGYDESYHGLGEQYSTTTLNNNLIPVVTRYSYFSYRLMQREQGMGRGMQPITAALNLVHFAGNELNFHYNR